MPVIRPPPISTWLYCGGASASCPGIPMYDWRAFTAVAPVMAPVFAIFPLATELMTPLAKAPAFGQGGIEGLPADGMAALPGGGRRGSLREFPAHDTRQAAGEGSIPAVVSRRASASASGRTEALAGYSFGGHAYAAHRHHGFAQHAAPGMPDVYPQAAHKAVHLLRDFQERDGAEKPNEDVPGNGGAALCGDLLPYLFFRQGRGRDSGQAGQQQNQNRYANKARNPFHTHDLTFLLKLDFLD